VNKIGNLEEDLEEFFKRVPCKDYIMTSPQNPVNSSLQYTPYKGMNYHEMINKIREDRASETQEFADYEKMRQNLQINALKKAQLLSD
jgi:hypothetical protein